MCPHSPVSEPVYNAVLLWAYAVNKTLSEGDEPDDGLTVTRNMYNLTFEGVVRPVSIDEKGDSKLDDYISIFQPGWQVRRLPSVPMLMTTWFVFCLIHDIM